MIHNLFDLYLQFLTRSLIFASLRIPIRRAHSKIPLRLPLTTAAQSLRDVPAQFQSFLADETCRVLGVTCRITEELTGDSVRGKKDEGSRGVVKVMNDDPHVPQIGRL